MRLPSSTTAKIREKNGTNVVYKTAELLKLSRNLLITS
jgi:hypothetical protein